MTNDQIIELSKHEMVRHAAEDSPHEVAGIVWDDGKVTRLHNETSKHGHYRVSMDAIAEAVEDRAYVVQGEDIIPSVWGFYHSHPNNSDYPSPTDLECMREWWEQGFDFNWVIVIEDVMGSWVSAYNYAGVRVAGSQMADAHQ